MSDEVYKGYHIPKGALVMANSWYLYQPIAIWACLAYLCRSAGRYCTTRRYIPTQKYLGQSASSRTDARTIATSHLATEGGQYYFSSQSSLGHSCAHGAMSNRVCPGRWFATEAVWVAIVSILASFDIVPSMDKQGKPKPVTIDCTTGAVSFVSFLQLVSTVSSMDEMLTVASM